MMCPICNKEVWSVICHCYYGLHTNLEIIKALGILQYEKESKKWCPRCNKEKSDVIGCPAMCGDCYGMLTKK